MRGTTLKKKKKRQNKHRIFGRRNKNKCLFENQEMAYVHEIYQKKITN